MSAHARRIVEPAGKGLGSATQVADGCALVHILVATPRGTPQEPMKPEDASTDPELRRARKGSRKKHIRGSTLLLAGRGIGIALNFAVQVLIVRHLAKADYGAFAYAMSLMLFGSHVELLGSTYIGPPPYTMDLRLP